MVTWVLEDMVVKVRADERLRGGVGNDGCMLLAAGEDGGNKPFCVLRLCQWLQKMRLKKI
ncbi:hypothetical protein [Bartonella harrusi]|uniref:Uncharacterized protein n=1 Tax=Bartonella harrusi TaxID=2961895 RepID=A0ABY5EVW3_9HYPH|nr:hypothetical protein [Bartonella harrusi]UTO28130.1 hypothetical protein NMK50_08030 [Bartonella harrusi]